MEIGTILVNRWGYEQTNVDFYQVITEEKTMRCRICSAPIFQGISERQVL